MFTKTCISFNYNFEVNITGAVSTFNKGAKATQWGKNSLFKKWY